MKADCRRKDVPCNICGKTGHLEKMHVDRDAGPAASRQPDKKSNKTTTAAAAGTGNTCTVTADSKTLWVCQSTICETMQWGKNCLSCKRARPKDTNQQQAAVGVKQLNMRPADVKLLAATGPDKAIPADVPQPMDMGDGAAPPQYQLQNVGAHASTPEDLEARSKKEKYLESLKKILKVSSDDGHPPEKLAAQKTEIENLEKELMKKQHQSQVEISNAKYWHETRFGKEKKIQEDKIKASKEEQSSTKKTRGERIKEANEELKLKLALIASSFDAFDVTRAAAVTDAETVLRNLETKHKENMAQFIEAEAKAKQDQPSYLDAAKKSQVVPGGASASGSQPTTSQVPVITAASMNRGIVDQAVGRAINTGQLVLTGQPDGGLNSLLDFVFAMMDNKAVLTTIVEPAVPTGGGLTPRPPPPALTKEQTAAALVARGKRGTDGREQDGTGELLEKQQKIEDGT